MLIQTFSRSWSRRISVCLIILLFLRSQTIQSQRVLYSPFIDDNEDTKCMVAGKAGEIYWLEKEKIKKRGRRSTNATGEIEQSFDLYDGHLNLVNSIARSSLHAQTLKEYLVASDRFFDALTLSEEHGSTVLRLQRYTPEGLLLNGGSGIGSFPFIEPGDRFLLIISEDKNKLLLLGFESVASSPPRMHALLFNADWKLLTYNVYNHAFITQPFIQDDFIGFPAGHYNNSPVQLANNGQWLMASPSRTNSNFLLFHFRGTDSVFSYKEIVLPPAYTMEDIALSIDNSRSEAFAGILSGLGLTTHKHVRVTHYSMTAQHFDFDSSYRFNTMASGATKKENLTTTYFTSVPGDGFMLMKEYGRSFTDWYNPETYSNQWDPVMLLGAGIIPDSSDFFPLKRDGYSRYNRLAAARMNFGRGDLNIFYFPGHATDSCWSGILNKSQQTELHEGSLSYLMIPSKDMLYFVYNSFVPGRDFPGSTAILDHRGYLQPDPDIIFWKFNNILLFQQSRQIGENEVAIPYTRNQRTGFAILRF